MTGWTASNGLSNTLQYDTDGRLTRIQVPGTQSLSFTYDDANRIIHIANGIDDKASESLGYDAMSQLRTVYSDIATVTYRYDAAGNRISHSINGAVTTATYATGSNRLQHLGGATTATYSYDPQGNTTGISSGATYHYNAFNRLDSAAGTTYYINPAGQRLRKHGSGGTTLFAPSNGGTLLAEKLNGVWIDYLWLNGRLIGRIHNGQVDTIHADQVGRPEVMTDANQDVIWWSDGKPFGRQVLITSTLPLNLGFPGQYHDAETGMWHNGFRDYNADTGRYLQSDPMGLVAGVNTYIYVMNNPLSHVDIRGLAVGDEYRTIDEAAMDALDEYVVVSLLTNREYAGVIYRNWNGTYSYTAANRGSNRQSHPGSAPWFHDEVGIYHTHGAPDPGEDSEHFSRPWSGGIGDIGLSDELGVLMYLETPSFSIKRYSPCTKKVIILRKGVL